MEFIMTLKILKENGIDIKNIQTKDTIESILKEQGIKAEKQKIIIEKIKDITNNFSIGNTLRNQKKKNNRELFNEELNKTISEATGEKIFTEEEIAFLTEIHISKDQTRDFIDILIILKQYGVNIREIKRRDTIESILEKQEIEEERKKEIIYRIKDITYNFNIGMAFNHQKENKVAEKFKNALNETINEETGKKMFTEEEIRCLTEKQKSNDQTRDFIDILIILKQYGVDIREINRRDTIESILEKQGIDEEKQKEIIGKIKDITNHFNIGMTLSTQKWNNNIEKLKKGLNEAISEETGEKIFTEEEVTFLTEIRRTNQTREFIETLKILKENGIDIRIIQFKDTIESILKKQGIKEERKEEIIEKIKEITNNFNIGTILNTQKKNNNIEKFKKGLKDAISKVTSEKTFTEEEIRCLTEKQKSNDQTGDFIDILIILKQYGVDIREIKRRDTIESILEKQDIEEEKQKEIIGKINEITNNLNIGMTLSTQKRNDNIENLKKGLNEAISEETGEKIFTEEEIKFLIERHSGKKLAMQVVIEQKARGELGENSKVESVIFEDTIRHIENSKMEKSI